MLGLSFFVSNVSNSIKDTIVSEIVANEASQSSWISSVLYGILYFVLFILQTILWIVLFSLLLVWCFQSQLLYMSNSFQHTGERRQLKYNDASLRTPASLQLPFEENFLRTEDGTMIHTWLLLQEGEAAKTAPTIIYFHGNAGNIGHRLPNAATMYRVLKCNILMVEYRGYGNSQGEPSEKGLQMDAIASIDFILARADAKELNPKRIFVFGRSLGGAVSIWLASKRPDVLAGVIVENTFTSIADMAFVLAQQFIAIDRLGPKTVAAIRFFLRFFMTSHWTSLDYIKRNTLPTLFISGQADELVPPVQMENLFQSMPDVGTKKIYKVAKGTHNETFRVEPEIYYTEINRFMTSASTNRVY